MAKHKYAHILRALADDDTTVVEYRSLIAVDGQVGQWKTITNPGWDTSYEYRIKPLPDIIRDGVVIFPVDLVNTWKRNVEVKMVLDPYTYAIKDIHWVKE